jgi:hypothetical protein
MKLKILGAGIVGSRLLAICESLDYAKRKVATFPSPGSCEHARRHGLKLLNCESFEVASNSITGIYGRAVEGVMRPRKIRARDVPTVRESGSAALDDGSLLELVNNRNVSRD